MFNNNYYKETNIHAIIINARREYIDIERPRFVFQYTREISSRKTRK